MSFSWDKISFLDSGADGTRPIARVLFRRPLDRPGRPGRARRARQEPAPARPHFDAAARPGGFLAAARHLSS
jgi:hypothetical protein